MNNKIKISIFCIYFTLGSSTSLTFAQGFDAVSLSMGGAYSGVARGVESLAWNPATLGLPRANWFELNFLSLNLNVSNSSLTIDNYKRYFTESGHNGFWDESDKDEILDFIPDDGFKTMADLNSNFLGMAFGNFGFSVQFLGKGLGVFPKSPFELILKGNVRDEFLFDDIDANAFSAVKVSFASGIPITFDKYFDDFAIGFNLSYLYGLGVVEVIDSQGSFFTGDEYLDAFVSVRGRIAQGGKGFSFDLGAAGTMNEKWTFSLALKNLVGGMNWTKQTEEFTVDLEVDSLEIGDPDNIDPELHDSTFAINSFTSRIPFVLQLGAAYQLREDLMVSMDIEQAFSNKLGYSDEAQVSIGAQYFPTPMLPLRTGMTVGGKWGFRMGFGFGLHFGVFKFDFAYSMHRALWPTYSTGFSSAFNIKYSF